MICVRSGWKATVQGARTLALLGAGALTLLLSGCPKDQGPADSGVRRTASWVVFEVYDKGSGSSLEATVWGEGMPDHFETVAQGSAGAGVRFYGLGRIDDGYALPFSPGKSVNLMVWSPGHKLAPVSITLKRGENVVLQDLQRVETEDQDVPERIRIEVLQSLPSQGPKSGS